MHTSDYTHKRNFDNTPEPGEDKDIKDLNPFFVIQKHDATNMHYDFRILVDGTLKSWSVPKGPSTDPRIKRMAIPTEDHPVAYADFEGVIPKGEYGGGTVMIWDKGPLKNLKTDKDGREISLKKSYEMGTIEIELSGKKIRGGYALIQMKGGKMKGNWLLVKMKDKEADARRNPVNTENKSVVSGRSMKEIEKEK